MLTVDTVRRRMELEDETPVLAWAVVDPRGMRLPGQLSVPKGVWPPYVALTTDELLLCVDFDTRRYPIHEVVTASLAIDPCGAMKVDFVEGSPLVLFVKDDGALLRRLCDAIQRSGAGARSDDRHRVTDHAR